MTSWQIVWFLIKLIFRRVAAELPQELAPKAATDPQPPPFISAQKSTYEYDPVSSRMVRR